jgi:DNA helicase-2/ATP-dependent DNA helicase PcrA
MARPALAIIEPADMRNLMGIDFSAQQLAAITAPLEPGVIVAGAGTGKTTVMAARVVWLVATGRIRADQVLGLTFTNKASAELSRRVRDFLQLAGYGRPARPAADSPDELAEPTVLTYHAYAARLLTEHGLRIGHEPDTRLMADASRFQLAARAIRRHRGPVQHLNTWLPTSVTGLLSLDAQLSEHLVSPDDVRRFQQDEEPLWTQTRHTAEVAKTVATFGKRRELLTFVESYRRLKSDLAVMDFSDQMSRAAHLASSCREVGSSERDRFRVVLLDEYQDTSVAQARLLRALYSDAVDPDGRGHPVTAVGDPCQAIYGWRGASVRNIDSFPADFPPADPRAATVRYPLTANRRSQSRIIDVANDIAAPLYTVHAGSSALMPGPGAGEGTVRAALLETLSDELDFLARELPAVHRRPHRPSWSSIGVLVRDNTMASAVHEALNAVGVPVEVIGLSGLLTTPEVSEVVATLAVLHDVTANASMLALLTGPRWAIGVRDLALLGRRAHRLAGSGAPPSADGTAVSDELERAVTGVDPADVVSLVEALENPGDAPYSAEALERFAALAAELKELRRYVGEPLLDLVRRVIDVTAIDVELASSRSLVAAARRDNVSSFVDAVAAFAGIDNDASLPGLLAYFEAEEEYARGLSLALPTAADSVKLLTVHRAKGLEWDVVFLPGVCDKVFPPVRGRGRWPTSMEELPSPLRGDRLELPSIPERSSAGLKTYVASCRELDLLEERRLAYVAVTRPRHELIVSCHWWGPEQKQPRGPSVFMQSVIDVMASWKEQPEVDVAAPAAGAVNPANRALDSYPWPEEAGVGEVASRREAAALVDEARSRGWRGAAEAADSELLFDERALVEQWDRELSRLVNEARASSASEIVVPLPASLSATALLRLQGDPERFAEEIARPMPRKPSASARFGTRFHAWVESSVGQQQLLDLDDLPGRADTGIAGDVELDELIEAFAAGPFGTRTPYRVEAPFALVLAGQVVRGRIDAVYETDEGFLVVDWKTGSADSADPLQLAVYRVAWAELMGVGPESVQAAFYFVRSGQVVHHDDLPGRDALERLVSGAASPAVAPR